MAFLNSSFAALSPDRGSSLLNASGAAEEHGRLNIMSKQLNDVAEALRAALDRADALQRERDAAEAEMFSLRQTSAQLTATKQEVEQQKQLREAESLRADKAELQLKEEVALRRTLRDQLLEAKDANKSAAAETQELAQAVEQLRHRLRHVTARRRATRAQLRAATQAAVAWERHATLLQTEINARNVAAQVFGPSAGAHVDVGANAGFPASPAIHRCSAPPQGPLPHGYVGSSSSDSLSEDGEDEQMRPCWSESGVSAGGAAFAAARATHATQSLTGKWAEPVNNGGSARGTRKVRAARTGVRGMNARNSNPKPRQRRKSKQKSRRAAKSRSQQLLGNGGKPRTKASVGASSAMVDRLDSVAARLGIGIDRLL